MDEDPNLPVCGRLRAPPLKPPCALLFRIGIRGAGQVFPKSRGEGAQQILQDSHTHAERAELRRFGDGCGRRRCGPSKPERQIVVNLAC